MKCRKNWLYQHKVFKQIFNLGLFAYDHMPYQHEKAEFIPSLSEMTEKAIEILQKSENGFVLLVSHLT